MKDKNYIKAHKDLKKTIMRIKMLSDSSRRKDRKKLRSLQRLAKGIKLAMAKMRRSNRKYWNLRKAYKSMTRKI